MVKPYFQTIIEELCWEILTEPINQPDLISMGIHDYCPGNYDLIMNPRHCDQDLLVYGGSMGYYLLFKNKSDKVEWLLKYS